MTTNLRMCEEGGEKSNDSRWIKKEKNSNDV